MLTASDHLAPVLKQILTRGNKCLLDEFSQDFNKTLNNKLRKLLENKSKKSKLKIKIER